MRCGTTACEVLSNRVALVVGSRKKVLTSVRNWGLRESGLIYSKGRHDGKFSKVITVDENKKERDSDYVEMKNRGNRYAKNE